MPIEDTPHRIYISDLSAELSDIESDEDTPIFLSDIEKHLSKIPRHVLLMSGGSSDPQTADDNQLVLYEVPKSLSVGTGQEDYGRKAIVEARRRIRERQMQGNNVVGEREVDRGSGVLGGGGVERAVEGEGEGEEDDGDAMDID